MSDPVRLISEWQNDQGCAALRSACDDVPPRGAAARALASVSAAMAVGAVVPTAEAASSTVAGASKGAALGGSAGVLKAAAVGAFLGLCAVAGAEATGPAESSRPLSSAAPAPVVSSAVVDPRPVVAAPEPAPVLSMNPSARATAPVRTPPERDASLALELMALENARAALGGGDPARALSLLDAYAAHFPTGALGAEATVLRVEALQKAGQPVAARALGERFLSANPSSPYRPRVQALLEKSTPR